MRLRTSRAVGDEMRAEIARMFSLDVDATGFAEVGRHDPVIGALQAQRPGLRPVCFWSTWEAAVWAVLVQRTSMVQAARAKNRMAHELGDAVTVGAHELQAFPSPVRLLEQRAKVDVPVVKRTWLCGLAEAALEGALDARPPALPRRRRGDRRAAPARRHRPVLGRARRRPGRGPPRPLHHRRTSSGEADGRGLRHRLVGEGRHRGRRRLAPVPLVVRLPGPQRDR